MTEICVHQFTDYIDFIIKARGAIFPFFSFVGATKYSFLPYVDVSFICNKELYLMPGLPLFTAKILQ
jgi:hypothetical protein